MKRSTGCRWQNREHWRAPRPAPQPNYFLETVLLGIAALAGLAIIAL